MAPEISIIIPNWNGKAFLNRCLGATIQDATISGRTFEVILVDDASTDGSGQDAASRFPSLRYISKPVNEGFGKAINDAANAALGSTLVLVNNDLIPKPGFVNALTEPIAENPALFGVSGRTVSWNDDSPNHVNMHGRWMEDRLALTWSDDQQPSPTIFLQGGSCAVRRDRFLKLGGFHPLYWPGYWEDYDISYLALKAGYQNLYQPAAIGSHLGQGSMIRAYGQERIAFIRERNRVLFHLLNLSDALFAQFFNNLPRYICRNTEPRFKHRLSILTFIWKNRIQIRRERHRRSHLWRLTDEQILQPFKSMGNLC